VAIATSLFWQLFIMFSSSSEFLGRPVPCLVRPR
jgi:hypothetical protein